MRTILLFILYVVFTVSLIPLVLVCTLFRWSRPLIWAGKRALRIAPCVLGVRVSARGLENIQKGIPYVFMANHMSFLDGPLLFMLIPQPVRVILKKEVFRIPVIGWGMRQVEFIPVDRGKLKGGRRSIQRAVGLIREKGYSFLIFPEGTRSRDGRLQAFRRGGFFLALESKVPIIPVSITGTFELMPKGAFFVRRGRVRVLFRPPVPVQGTTRESLQELMEKVRGIILEGVDPPPDSQRGEKR